MDYEVSGTKLNVNGIMYDFKHNINGIIKIKKLILVHIFDSIDKRGSIDISRQPVNNIYGVNEQGRIEWNIKEIVKNDEMYTEMKIDSDGHLVLNTFLGIAFIIDVNKKEIVNKYLIK